MPPRAARSPLRNRRAGSPTTRATRPAASTAISASASRRRPWFSSAAEGPYLFDADGNRLIDYYLGMGPMILGHSPAAVATPRSPAGRAGHPLRRADRGRGRGGAAGLRDRALRRAHPLRPPRAPRWCRRRSAWPAPRPGAAIILSSRAITTAGSTTSCGRTAPALDAAGPAEGAGPASPAAPGRTARGRATSRCCRWNDLELLERAPRRAGTSPA